MQRATHITVAHWVWVRVITCVVPGRRQRL